MTGGDTAVAAGRIREIFALNVLVLTGDERLARDVERVCGERGHALTRIELLRDLHLALTRRRPNVLLIDTGTTPAEGARIAATVVAIHRDLPVVLAADGPQSRSEGGFRLVDSWRTGERVVDELELAHIGIPASMEEAFPDLRM